MIQNIAYTIYPVDTAYHTTIDLSTLTGTDVTGFSGYTVVSKILLAENIVGGERVRLSLRAPNSANGSVSAVYFGEAATTGNAYNFASTPKQITFGGKTGLTLTAKKVFTSDPVIVDFNPGKSHIVAMNVNASTILRGTAPAGVRQIVSYYKAATSEAGTVSKASGYTSQANAVYSLLTIEASRVV